MTTKAIRVARFFIRLSACESEPEYMSPMRLQKLLYYAQGWRLALDDETLFSEKIEAWAYGPVVPSVYQVFKKVEAPIPPAEGSDEGLDSEEQEFVSRVWESYKGFSAIKLSQMTHLEPPWRDARKGLRPEARSDREITPKAMKAYFRSLVK